MRQATNLFAKRRYFAELYRPDSYRPDSRSGFYPWPFLEIKPVYMSMLIRKAALAVVLAFALLPLAAQNNDEVVSQWGSWFMYFGNHRLSDKWALHTEYQWRRSAGIRTWQQSLARVGLNYFVGENAITTAGYAYIITYPYGQQPIAFTVQEHRIWQELILNQRAGRFHFQHRYRLEQRWLEQREANIEGEPETTGWRYQNRARYRLFAAIPLNQPLMGRGAFFLGLYDEVFLGFGKNVSKKNVLDQNRFYAALGYQFLDTANVQMGYLNHQVFKADGVRREINHTFQLALFYNLDFRSR